MIGVNRPILLESDTLLGGESMVTKTNKVTPKIFLSAFVLLTTSSLTAAPVSATSNCLPAANGYYAGGIEAWVTAQGNVNLSNPVHSQFTNCTPQPSTNVGTSWNENFGSFVTGTLFLNGSNMGPVVAQAAVSISLLVTSNSGGVETLSTQMTQLDVNLGGGHLIRIDPTTPSTGQTTVTTLPGGVFQINSFFDVFTDLSLDGGLTWNPSSGGNGQGGGALMTLQATPEPGSVALFGAGLVLLLSARHYRIRSIPQR
jgi:hypothetical protein